VRRFGMTSATRRRLLGVGLALAATLVIAACGEEGTAPAVGAAAGAVDLGLSRPGTLSVGMNLQFKPQMYLDAAGEPAGYDVALLELLAAELGVQLDIQNLDFGGLIPGLQSRKFDLVSVGLSATDERRKVIDFTRAYVPYTSVLAVAQSDESAAALATYDAPAKVITALQGSTAEQLARKSFPNATVKGFSEQSAALLEVATGRAQASVLEDYFLTQFQKAHPNQVKKAPLAEPLQLSYGSWAVHKGNHKLVERLDAFLCKLQSDGSLGELYRESFGAEEVPRMPEGC
jgi:ABC-type amino acid transport substrate-binding protein